MRPGFGVGEPTASIHMCRMPVHRELMYIRTSLHSIVCTNAQIYGSMFRLMLSSDQPKANSARNPQLGAGP